MTEYSFNLSDKEIPSIITFHEQIEKLVPSFLGINKNSEGVQIILSEPPTEQIISLIESLTPATSLDAAVAKIKKAMDFGTYVMVEFAAENMLLGIVSSGKTKEVADFLADANRYLSSGSLYEVSAEIDRLYGLAIFPEELAPFITKERLSAVQMKILEYLNEN